MVIITPSLIHSMEEAEVSNWYCYLQGLQQGDFDVSLTSFGQSYALKARGIKSGLMNRVKNFSSVDLSSLDDIIQHYEDTETSFSIDLVPDLVDQPSELYTRLLDYDAKPIIHYTQHIYDLTTQDQQVAPQDDFRVMAVSSADKFADTFVRGFGLTGEKKDRQVIQQSYGWSHPDLQCFLAIDSKTNRSVATGVLHCSDENIGVLSGATTVPEFRGRGIQQSLIQYRLHQAQHQGMKYVISDATAGGTSSRNLQRQGFTIAYTRTYWKIDF